MPEFINSLVVKTRVPHVCWGCGDTFPKGTEMLCITSSDMGKIASSYFCSVCDETMAESKDDFRDDGIGFGDLKTWREENKRVAIKPLTVDGEKFKINGG